MNKTKIEHFKKLLIKWQKTLLHEMRQTVNQISHDDEVYADWTDIATVETDKAMQLKIRDRERMLLTKIQEALNRIENGIFGECERCGEEISEQRLKARPVTTLCIDCKAEIESTEHRYSYS